MNSSKPNNWNRPWSVEEMKENAENWSLAGDVALLNTIQAFSEKLLNKSGEISDKIDTLLNNLDEVGLKLDLAQNEFQNLKNTQFIESRVYDDDETLDSNGNEKLLEKPIPEDEQERLIINSIKMGMEILDEYYDKLEVSVSDSEEEAEKSNFCEYILKPKDIYSHRPLPPIIGSEEWYQKWHLDIPSSDSDTDGVSDIYSESDSEDNLPKDLMKGSETSSELDFSSHVSENRPVANSTFNSSSQHVDLESSSAENEDQESLHAKVQLSNKSFAEQLAAKLGNIISEQEVVSEEINKRPIQPAKISNFGDIPFDDEPPPFDEFEQSMLPKNIQSGYFSGGQGLFDDNSEDELFWGQPNKPEEINNKLVEETEKHHSSKRNKGLFDESSSDDETFTSSKKQFNNNKKYLQPQKPLMEPNDGKPPDEKKPVGGVRLIESSDIFNDQKISKILKGTLTGDDTLQSASTTDAANQEISSKPKRRNLFDVDEVDDFLYVESKNLKDQNEESSSKPKRKNLFSVEEDEDFFNVESEKLKEGNKTNLFKNLADDLDKDENATSDSFKDVVSTDVKFSENSIHNTQSTDVNKTITNARKADLFDNEEIIQTNKPKKVSLFDEDDDLFNDDFFSNITNSRLSSKLFEDIEENCDNVFSIKYEQETIENTTKDTSKKVLNNIQTENVITDNGFSSDKIKESITINNENTPSDSVIKVRNVFENSSVPVISGSPESEQRFSKQESNKTEKSQQKTSDKAKKTLGLFDDSDMEDDSIFVYKMKSELNSFEPSPMRSNQDTTENNKNEDKVAPRVTENEESKYEPVQPEEQISSSQQPVSSGMSKEKTENPVISIFDSIPPPDDCEDWDAKSDSLSDTEDFLPYQAQETFSRSSVFDDEPPSLGPNESSGIVRDYNATRNNESSFIPHASSSRRLSSEIFSDEQSQDSFFITKNRTDSVNPASLDIIPEMAQSDITDITPSGNIKEFDSTTELHKDKKQYTSLSKENSVLVENLSPSKRFLPPIEDKGMTENPISSRIASIKQSLQSENVQKPAVEPRSSPGKLKLNLNINVNALRPGLRPPKIGLLPKSHSLELPNPDKEYDSESTTNYSSTNILNAKSFEQNSTFEANEENVKVLHSITKDRVKIPVKRKPSTRRGRHEAIRKSAVDLSFHYEENSDETIPVVTSSDESNKAQSNNHGCKSDTSTESTVSNETKINPLADEPAAISIAKIISTESFIKNRNLFDDFGDNELFFESPQISEENIPSRHITNKATKNLVEISNDNSSESQSFEGTRRTYNTEIYATKHSSPERKTLENPAAKEIVEVFNKSETSEDRKGEYESTKKGNVTIRLFDDDGTEDDIFFSSNSVHNDNENDTTTAVANVAQSTENKLKNKKQAQIFSDSDDELFSNVSKIVQKKGPNRLFGSENESDGELFGDLTSEVTEQKISAFKSVKSKEHSKKPLFNDSSSDEDLFSSSSKIGKSKGTLKEPIIRIPKAHGFKKSENKETAEDPLSKLL